MFFLCVEGIAIIVPLPFMMIKLIRVYGRRWSVAIVVVVCGIVSIALDVCYHIRLFIFGVSCVLIHSNEMGKSSFHDAKLYLPNSI